MAQRTIQSPGVEIREKDLSLRTQTPIGTNILVPGFAPQGPTGEPILITTISEFEQVFGTPSTAAERYFYYSMKEAVQSNANVWTVRIPYGAVTGEEGWTNSYSALFYPMTQSFNLSGWDIGAPKNVTLTLEQYTKLLRGDFEWGTQTTQTTSVVQPLLSSVTYSKETSADGLAFAINNDLDKANVSFSVNGDNVVFTFQIEQTVTITVPVVGGDIFAVNGDGDITTNAGFFIVNTLQTSINEVGEGYYIGISTNESAKTENFDSIQRMTSLSAISGANYFTIPQNRLEFRLQSTKDQSDAGVTSISEILESPGFQAYSLQEYSDHLSFAVYRIRRSLADTGVLALASTEQYLGSLDSTRKRPSPTGGVLENAFIEDLVNTGSGSVKIVVNPAVSRYSWSQGSSIPNRNVRVLDEAKSLYPAGVYSPNTIAIDKAKQIGNVPYKLRRALDLAKNAETYTIDVICDAGLSTIYSVAAAKYDKGLGNFNDEVYVKLDDSFGNNPLNGSVLQNWKSVVDEVIYFAADARKDCVAIVDPPRLAFVTGRDTKVLEEQNSNFTQNVYGVLQRCFGTLDSNYATSYANWIKVNDQFTSKKFWLPFSAYAATCMARSDAASNPWAAPAGFARTQFNCIDIALNPNQKQRDKLYEIPLNPVIFFSGDGYAIYGQKTLQNRPTAFDRINVRRLFLSLQRTVSKAIRSYVFEPNTSTTRSNIVTTLSPAFEYAKNTDGLFDYLIVCDDRNNGPNVIDNGELVVDIYIKPVRTAEFILINFIATRTGQEFSEVL